jgi:hypothetical protein
MDQGPWAARGPGGTAEESSTPDRTCLAAADCPRDSGAPRAGGLGPGGPGGRRLGHSRVDLPCPGPGSAAGPGAASGSARTSGDTPHRSHARAHLHTERWPGALPLGLDPQRLPQRPGHLPSSAGPTPHPPPAHSTNHLRADGGRGRGRLGGVPHLAAARGTLSPRTPLPTPRPVPRPRPGPAARGGGVGTGDGCKGATAIRQRGVQKMGCGTAARKPNRSRPALAHRGPSARLGDVVDKPD